MADDLKLDLSVPFGCSEEALIACRSLSVDPEPKRGCVKKEISVAGNILNVSLTAKEARTLRVSANSFMDHLILVTKTIQEFGPPLEDTKSS
ncbi:uncharacterized protein LOC5499582 [Nematostella vectensis]|uniref:uncharacterized protein LOC5520449 n=1 Tax=Nematostella vectensis TaxID=45351 RepID=UPI002076EC5E|nr:uncharacterized protein LOC5520449 [Nematostella vectensis]XP_048580206.1 uncharacterized protein LOC5499582 [Nematostella vectensis]